jgi:flagellar motor switch/type III secretory pathway protein FliN
MNLVNQASKAPFNAEALRAKGTNLLLQLSMLAPLANALTECIGADLSTFTQVPIKVSLIETRTEKLLPLAQIEAGFNLVAGEETLCCWCKPDRAFDQLMREVCLGGRGAASPDGDFERPVTTIDKRLANLVNEKLFSGIAKAMTEVSERSDISVQQRPRTVARNTGNTRSCYYVRLLFNLFDQDCECELFMSLVECMLWVGGADLVTDSNSTSAASIIERTPFCVEVYLKSDVLDIRQILNLAPGEVLKLNVTASTPVELKLNGTDLSKGLLSYRDDGGHVRLISTSRKDVQIANGSSSFAQGHADGH